MTSIDPFTAASATYQNATRLGFKSGVAWEGFTPRPIPWGRLTLVAAALLPAVGLYFGAMK